MPGELEVVEFRRKATDEAELHSRGRSPWRFLKVSGWRLGRCLDEIKMAWSGVAWLDMAWREVVWHPHDQMPARRTAVPELIHTADTLIFTPALEERPGRQSVTLLGSQLLGSF